MRLLICGSRSIKNANIDKYVEWVNDPDIEEIICGGAIGVDRSVQLYAERMNIPLTVVRPEYNWYGKRAPIVRDKLMADMCDEVLAFWDGHSKGTKFTIDYAIENKKKIHVFVLS